MNIFYRVVQAGDRSLVDLIAHEIAHSWTGNLVTNSNFEHFWLNEGFTVFIERKINGRLHGEPFRHFSAIGGKTYLADTVGLIAYFYELQFLKIILMFIDWINGLLKPYDLFGTRSYRNRPRWFFFCGALWKRTSFLVVSRRTSWWTRYIFTNNSVLNKELNTSNLIAEFDPFLKSYIANFQYRSIVTSDFVEYIKHYFKDTKAADKLENVDWKTWFHSPGMPITFVK